MITKEQWEEIEKALKGSMGVVKFKLGEKQITLEKRFIKENVMVICVFINGKLEQKAGWPGDDYDPAIEPIWNKRSRSVYSPNDKKRAEKIFGKRRAKKEFDDWDKRVEWYEPFFKTFASMQRKYKKIEGLEFVRTDFVNL
ncbi:hypothetical protein A8139_21480 [Marinomonas primoryensis]|uniref:Uncharacterized protein n=1 Tax=Marinomonas primoryensis TaxID=178399 RepID=A0A2Z4PM90_9GAMM|nr:hypothetical protein [Marinomonas primoryensis]AWX98700.1 hypothetical protein A8139_00855 [Marinomonas primoryensis]AWY02223.1 hypothetical protein A8139_21480 [Marinomonas primoryensis]